MIEKHSLSIQRITDFIKTNYGIDVAALTLLPVGADMNASVYKAQTHGQSSYFIKLKRGHHTDISVILLTLLHEAGIQQIIPPLKTIQGQTTQAIDDFTLIVYPFVKGNDGFSRDLTDQQWFMLGKVLKQVHAFNVPSSIQERIRRETYSPRWRDEVRSIYAHVKTEQIGDEWSLKILEFLKEHREMIHLLVDRAELLSQKVKAKSSKFVLCHSDIHGGNVLLDEKGAIYIVDWDDPILAPKERDLMFIGGGVANVWNNPHEEEFFYKGYGVTEIDQTILSYYRYERIVVDIVEYANEFLSHAVSNKDRSEMYKQFTDMFIPRGVVDIALKTDKSCND